MASKICLLLLASSLALLLVADASIIRTTVAEIEEDENTSRESCSMKLTPCMQWMRYSGRWNDEMNPDMSQEYKKQCCNMMSRLQDKECMCTALKKTYSGRCMSGGSQSFQGSTGMCSEWMPEKLMNVPKMCGFTQQKCNFRMMLA